MSVVILCATLTAQAPPKPTSWVDTAPPPSKKFPAEWYSVPDPNQFFPDNGATSYDAPVVGLPIIATTVMSTRISPDGEALRFSRMSDFTMRDSVGRTRVDEEVEIDGMPAAITSLMKKQIEVHDVVTHCTFQWVEPATTEADRTAKVRCLGKVTFTPNQMEDDMTRQVAGTEYPSPGETIQIEPLGGKEIAGVKAVGIRQRLTDPHTNSGAPESAEIWWSPEIKEMVEMKPIGEPDGRPTIEMTDIKRQEPDPSLFYPPAGYKIVPE